MRTIRDHNRLLGEGLALLRRQFKLPAGFPSDAEAEAAEAATAARAVPGGYIDATPMQFVTLDPAQSRDLDQAFTIEQAGNDYLLHYAIADVGSFVPADGAMDREAWARGTSLYLPDGKVPLYPAALGDDAASLLPDGERRAVIFTVRVDPVGEATLDGAQRANIRSRAKLAYETVREEDLPTGFAELVRRIEAAELARGAARIDPPEQEVVQEDGLLLLRLRPQTWSEKKNAALSLATNLAIAKVMIQAKNGLFRTMTEPPDWAVRRLRHTAKALAVEWPKKESLQQLERRLDPAKAADAAMMLAIRRASPGAAYQPFGGSELPWHAAVAAPYAHATAPLRRLADRYVVEAVLAIANGQLIPESIQSSFARLPDIMQKANGLSGQIDRAVIDLAEAVTLEGREGIYFAAIVTDIDQRGARIQIQSPPVVARIKEPGLSPGDEVTVRLDSVDPEKRSVQFSVAWR